MLKALFVEYVIGKVNCLNGNLTSYETVLVIFFVLYSIMLIIFPVKKNCIFYD